MKAPFDRTLSAMQVLPVDLSAILGITLGLMTVLIPIAGFTLRFALKPVVEALAVAWSARNSSREELALLEKRLALLERELELRRLPAVSAVSEVPARNSSVTVGA